MVERESFAVLGSIEIVRPAGERCLVIGVAELVVLPGVNEFVPDSRTKLLPPVVSVGCPAQRDHNLVRCRVVLCDLCKCLDALRNLPSKLL